tara:strand:- start:1474 stop:1611 length:138 start_codon:yes stop_codon:yes gene_type:complete
LKEKIYGTKTPWPDMTGRRFILTMLGVYGSVLLILVIADILLKGP